MKKRVSDRGCCIAQREFNGVINFRKRGTKPFNDVPKPEASIRGTKLNFYKAFAKGDDAAFKSLYITDDKVKVEQLRPYLEQFPMNFPIVRPRTPPQPLDDVGVNI